MAEEFTQEEFDRYARHFSLAGFGREGQLKLKNARILIVGCGGLGCPAIQYLAAAGVGTIGLVDFDRVSLSNLQRQILFHSTDVGRPKTEVARERIRALNLNIEVHVSNEKLTAGNVTSIADNYPIILDCSDNIPTRYLLNDYCVLNSKVLVNAAVSHFEGQITVFDAERGPCYRCLFPEPPPRESVLSCADEGIIGVLPGIAGLIQATETVKLIAGIGEPMVGRLLAFDALGMRFRSLKITKNPHCPICGESPTVRELIDYDLFCNQTLDADAATEITAAQLKADLRAGKKYQLLDVRNAYEVQSGTLTTAHEIPLDQLPERTEELPIEDEIIVFCASGNRSQQAIPILQAKGFSKVRSLSGGLAAWSALNS